MKRTPKQTAQELETALDALKAIASGECDEPKRYAFQAVADILMDRAMPEFGRRVRAAMSKAARERAVEALAKRRAEIADDYKMLRGISEAAVGLLSVLPDGHASLSGE